MQRKNRYSDVWSEYISVASYLTHTGDPCHLAVTEVWTELLTLLSEEEVNLIIISH